VLQKMCFYYTPHIRYFNDCIDVTSLYDKDGYKLCIIIKQIVKMGIDFAWWSIDFEIYSKLG
jgi:hypothetical protein